MQPLALLNAIGEMLPKDAVVIDETISSGVGIRSLIRSDDPQSFYGLRGGGIGWGLPAALGVKLALPDRPVVALVGDGSAMYTCQALWTAAHDKIAVVFVIFNNTSYRILKQRLHAQRGLAAQVDRFVGMELVDPAIDYRRPRALAWHRGGARQDRARDHRSHRAGLEEQRAAADRRAARPHLQADVVVIARPKGPKQSSGSSTGLLRRCAPRNDG